jgi:serine protease Do
MILFVLPARRAAAIAAAAAGLAATLSTPSRALAQGAERPPREEVRERVIIRAPGAVALWRGDEERKAVLGVTLAPASAADTAGVRVEAVTAGSPAEKAGIKAGDVLTQVNGVNLRVTRDDAEDVTLGGLGQRRLQRELGRLNAGDEVALSLRSGSSTRSLKVKTTSPAEVARLSQPEGNRVAERQVLRPADRQALLSRLSTGPTIGIAIGSAGNARDTLGLFVSEVIAGGPADKAGIVEGERVASVNGVDVRVPREDVQDAPAVSARVDRFVREVRKATPGQRLTLKVYGNGRYRDVVVTADSSRALSVPGVEGRVLRPGQGPRVFQYEGDGMRGRIQLDGRELEFDTVELGRYFEQMGDRLGRGLEQSLKGLELELRGMQPPVIMRSVPRRAFRISI